MPAKSAEQQAAYDAKRKRSEQLLNRLTAEEAERVRSAAASSGQSLADYVLAIVDDRPAPSVDLVAGGADTVGGRGARGDSRGDS